MVALQRTKKCSRALRLCGVLAHGTEHQRQRRAHGLLRLRVVGIQLLRQLLQRRALKLSHQFISQGV